MRKWSVALYTLGRSCMLPFRGFLGKMALESMDFSKPRSKRTATVAAYVFVHCLLRWSRLSLLSAKASGGETNVPALRKLPWRPLTPFSLPLTTSLVVLCPGNSASYLLLPTTAEEMAASKRVSSWFQSSSASSL